MATRLGVSPGDIYGFLDFHGNCEYVVSPNQFYKRDPFGKLAWFGGVAPGVHHCQGPLVCPRFSRQVLRSAFAPPYSFLYRFLRIVAASGLLVSSEAGIVPV
jgi:hypothetical protein